MDEDLERDTIGGAVWHSPFGILHCTHVKDNLNYFFRLSLLIANNHVGYTPWHKVRDSSAELRTWRANFVRKLVLLLVGNAAWAGKANRLDSQVGIGWEILVVDARINSIGWVIYIDVHQIVVFSEWIFSIKKSVLDPVWAPTSTSTADGASGSLWDETDGITESRSCKLVQPSNCDGIQVIMRNEAVRVKNQRGRWHIYVLHPASHVQSSW